MTDECPPTNDNRSFTSLIRNADRDRAEIVLKAFVGGMKEEGIPRAVIIRTLFDHVIHELGETPIGGDIATPAEEAENVAIINEIDGYWLRIRKLLKEHCPDALKLTR